jgi:hypothetical protein
MTSAALYTAIVRVVLQVALRPPRSNVQLSRPRGGTWGRSYTIPIMYR